MKGKASEEKNRRQFLRRSFQALLVPSARLAPKKSKEEPKTLPGDPGYRDPEAYGSEAD